MFVRKRGVSASSGTGIEIWTLFAVLRLLNCALAYLALAASPQLKWPHVYLQHVLYSAPRVTLDYALNPNQWLDLRIQTVAHQLELAIRRDETDRPVVLESRQAHTLMEFDIFHLDRLASCRPSCCFEHSLVIQAQPQFRHTGQVALHLDSTKNLGSQYISVCRHKEVE